ncbi:conjugal transfer protein TraR, partial [Klebsiella pneumoniae]|nr:conjugal transfer protein TraR [Klebsiella pneumoniae]EKU8768042.1 conjugal transfer protein TraR [Klebsiella pneumoniae]
ASLVALTPLSALADGSLTDMVDEGATGMSDVEKDALVFAEGLGVLIVFASIIAMKNKAKSPHITTGGIITGWVVGIFLIGLAEIVRRSQSQVGMTEVTVGSGS